MTTKWDRRFWELAEFVARWSKDPNAHVGAVLVTPRGGAIALGYNGFPAGVEDSAERLSDQVIKQDMIVHAEQNALVIAGPAAQNAEMFVHGKPVCSRCAGLMIQAGIRRVISMDPNGVEPTSKWRETGLRAIDMLKEARVEVSFLT